jgi:hypothetical protein
MFEVVFQGNIASGANPDEVKAKIGALFKVNDAQLARLFSGQRVVIKSGLDEATATKYRMAIEKAGALCEIVAMATASAQSIPPQTTAATPTQTRQTDPTTGFDVAPVGVDLGDNKPFVPANINVDHLSTAPVGADLEQLKEIFEPFNLDIDFDLAPVGSDLDEMPRLTVPLVMSEEMDNVSIADVGVALSDAKPAVTVAIKELNVEIAPAGSDLGEIKKSAPPPPPDTSHLKVEST